MKNAIENINSRLDQSEIIRKVEDRSLEIVQTGENNDKKKMTKTEKNLSYQSLRMRREGKRGRKIKETMGENASNVGRCLKIQVLEAHRFS